MLWEYFGEDMMSEVYAKSPVCCFCPAPGGMEAFKHIAPAAHMVGIDECEGFH
jgi:hypothetical protein